MVSFSFAQDIVELSPDLNPIQKRLSDTIVFKRKGFLIKSINTLSVDKSTEQSFFTNLNDQSIEVVEKNTWTNCDNGMTLGYSNLVAGESVNGNVKVFTVMDYAANAG